MFHFSIKFSFSQWNPLGLLYKTNSKFVFLWNKIFYSTHFFLEIVDFSLPRTFHMEEKNGPKSWLPFFLSALLGRFKKTVKLAKVSLAYTFFYFKIALKRKKNFLIKSNFHAKNTFTVKIYYIFYIHTFLNRALTQTSWKTIDFRRKGWKKKIINNQ